MKKKLFSILLCAALVFAMAVPAFAAEPSTEPMPGIENYSVDEQIQPRTNVGVQRVKLIGYNFYLNINNAGHSGKAYSGDAVIIWPLCVNDDEQWDVIPGYYGGYYFRSKLNLNLAMNINHVENKCTLHTYRSNTTNDKSDSDIYMNGDYMQLSLWPYQLTNSVLQQGYTSYWTASGSRYVCYNA
ncbi:MAG: hypothetical protein HDT27_04455 [Subdoligranulum sp.]|nr:hypothetical protein [Subdoligranulum sp.]